MIKWLQKIFGEKELAQHREWKSDDSILKFLSSNIDAEGKLKHTSFELPDEKKDDDKLRFAPGLMDTMFGVDDSSTSKVRVRELVKQLKRIANKGDTISEQEFFRLVAENDGVIEIIDNFLETIINESLPIEPYLFSFAKDLAAKTNKRNAVKFGIAILGLCQNKTVLNDLKILGLHDEFTVFATIAISNLTDNDVSELWDLSKKVNGWGKIQLVDRLTKMELTDQMREWLILEGYKNDIMYEYLAFTCATHGLLHEKLESKEIDSKLFKASADIIGALMVGGPAEDISEYIYASSVIKNFIRHARQYTNDISDFIILNNIKDFLSELHNAIGAHKQNGWNEDNITNCLIELSEILSQIEWRELALEGLKSRDDKTYWDAKHAAEKLGIDLWETVWAKLQQSPIDSSAWYDVTRYGKPKYADQIIAFALKNLPLDEFATGPKDSIGLGPTYSKFMCFDFVIRYLEDYPKKGERILITGLKSPITRNRNMVIKVLDKWKRKNWSTELEKEITNLKNIEPNNDTKKNIERLLSGQELM